MTNDYDLAFGPVGRDSDITEPRPARKPKPKKGERINLNAKYGSVADYQEEHRELDQGDVQIIRERIGTTTPYARFLNQECTGAARCLCDRCVVERSVSQIRSSCAIITSVNSRGSDEL